MPGSEAPYKAILRGWDEDEAMLASKQVAELLDHPGWTQLVRLLDEAHDNAFERLLGVHSGYEGKHLDHAEYVRLAAFLAGIKQTQIASEAFRSFAESVRRRNAQAVPSNAP